MTDVQSPDRAADPVVPTDMPESAVPLNSVGASLRLAREARGETLADVAQALRIGVRQVEAIENDHWAALPGIPFVRGFVRNYARWVGLNGDELVARIETTDLPGTPVLDVRASTTAVLPQGQERPRRDSAMLGFGLAAMVVAVVLYFLLPDDFWTLPGSMNRVVVGSEAPAPVPPVTRTALPTPAESPVPGPAAAAAVTAPVADAVVPATTVALPTPPPDVATPAAPVVEPASPVAPPALEFRFDARAWAEVRDSQGVPIFSETVDAGETRSVAGKGPFLVVVGRADAVRVRYKGKSVNLEPHSRRNVARLTLE